MTALYTIWALLNLSLLGAFIYLGIKAFRALRAALGTPKVLFLLVCILAQGSSTYSPDNETPAKATVPLPEGNNGLHLQSAIIDDNLFHAHVVLISYTKVGEKLLPLEAKVTESGLAIGTVWQTTSYSLNTTDDQKALRYEVSGIVKWSLMGVVIISQGVDFDGKVAVSE